MSVPVGALASKSRPITAVNWSSDSSTEKSSSPRKLAGNTSRPCLLITKGFTDHLLGELPGPGTVSAPYPDRAEYARPPGKSPARNKTGCSQAGPFGKIVFYIPNGPGFPRPRRAEPG